MFKKIFLTAIAFAVFFSTAYAQNYINKNEPDIDIVWNIANIGVDLNFDGQGNYVNMLAVEIANIYLQERKTSLGLHFTPFVYVNGSDDGDEIYRKISPLNLTVFWNPFWNIKKGGIFGPYVSVNYFLSEENDFVFGAGLYFSVFSSYLPNGSFINNVVYVKAGYRFINDKNAYYIGINTDIWQLLKWGLLSWLSSGSGTYDSGYSSSSNSSSSKKQESKEPEAKEQEPKEEKTKEQKSKERNTKERKSKENKPEQKKDVNKDKKKNKTKTDSIEG
ncbi:MAG: hypothetical protein FWF32_03610 [Endomicrobia bacterium]|nr:hypothetical protein [Endomicrobiia bacterium]